MARLHIHFQEGFSNDTAVLHLDDTQIFRKTALTTRLQIGLADTIEVEAADGAARLKVEIPTRGLEEVVALDLSDPTYLGITLTREGTLSCRVSSEPFGYL